MRPLQGNSCPQSEKSQAGIPLKGRYSPCHLGMSHLFAPKGLHQQHRAAPCVGVCVLFQGCKSCILLMVGLQPTNVIRPPTQGVALCY